jgi:hypothetical protein
MGGERRVKNASESKGQLSGRISLISIISPSVILKQTAHGRKLGPPGTIRNKAMVGCMDNLWHIIF